MKVRATIQKIGRWRASQWLVRTARALRRCISRHFWQSDLREFIWPLLRPRSAAENREEAKRLSGDRAVIKEADFSQKEGAALEEARRLADAEAERRKSADQKASTYLAIVAALAPLLLAGATAIWEGKAGSAPPTLNMLLLGLALIYMAAAGIWAFRVIEVSPSHRIGADDIAAAWKEKHQEAELARKIMWAARSNYADVNRKVSRIKMTHAYLLRAFLTFVLLLLFNVLFFIISETSLKLDQHSKDPWLESANSILLADERIHELNAQLLITPAWRVFAPSCGRGTKRDLIGTVVYESWMRAGEHPTLANAFGNRTVRFRKLRLYCDGDLPLKVRVWDRAIKSPSDHNSPRGIGVLLPIVEREAAIRAIRLWPSRHDTERQSLPPILLRQSIVVRAPTGNISAILEIEVDRRALPMTS